MRQVLLSIILIFGIVFFSFMFSNCSKSNISGGASNVDISSDEEPPTEGKQFNLTCISSKLARSVSEKNIGYEQKTTQEFLTSGIFGGQTLSVTVDGPCVYAGNQLGYFSRLLVEKMHGLSDRQTVTFLVINPDSLSGESLLAELNSDSCLVSVFPNVQMDLMATTGGAPDDPKYIEQNYLKTIHHDEVYSRIFNSSNGINQIVKVAVIDTGVDVNHPDLRANYIIDSSNQVFGLNAIDNNNIVQDALFHGSHVSGIIGAISNNSVGVSGVLGQKIKMLPVRVSSDGESINSAATVNGIRWAADQGADVINMSLGGPIASGDMKMAIEYAISKGALVVVAAGNDGKQLSDSFSIYPAKWGSSLEGMITVGSIDATTLARSSFSNYSPTYVEMMAPGSDGTFGILSTVPTSLSSGYARVTYKAGVSYPINGTSMSSPVVAGAGAMVIALAKSRGYRPQPAQVERLMKKSSRVLAGLAGFVQNSQSLDLKELIDVADRDMGISSLTTTSRYSGSGVLKIARQPQAQNVLHNQSISLDVELSQDSTILVNYQWYKNDKAILGATKPAYKIPAANSQSGGLYSVEIKAGSTVLRSESIEVYTAPSYCN